MRNNTTVFDCTIIELPRIKERCGNITPIHGLKDIPFEIARVFYIYDIPGGEDRGAHAHKICQQVLIAASGSFEIELDDGKNKRTVFLNRPYFGLHISPGIWAAERCFSSGSICLTLASERYTESDYLRNYDDYLEFKGL